MPNLTKTGRYELLDELGRGAMGVVYRAHDPVIGRDVAVKTLHLSSDGSGVTPPEFITRFQTEARAAGILTHPNIVVVYDAGEESGTFFITMELVEGLSLQGMLDAQQTFPLPRALKIVEQACGALEYAHQHNIVHRDVKPANLMITKDDTVKITDFGTAKILRFNSTQTAQVIGTPSYMSPEQIKGKAVDGRSDIFALGVILYELVTGEKPFPGQNVTTVIYKIVSEEPIPPRQLAPDIHPGLAALIMRALAKEPAERFQTCGEMLEGLKNYRSFPHERKEELHPAYMPPPAAADPSAIKVRPRIAKPRPVIALAEIAPPPPVMAAPTHGHTLYEPTGKKSRGKSEGKSWSAFWTSLLLLGVIGASGYYVRPYTHDVWQVVRTWYDQKRYGATPATNVPAVAPDATVPDPELPGLPSKKGTNSLAASPKGQHRPSTDGAPPQKTKPEANAAAPDTADPIAQQPGSVGAPNSVTQDVRAKSPGSPVIGSQPTTNSKPASNPPVGESGVPTASAAAPLTPRERLDAIKGRLDRWLVVAGLNDRVQVSVIGGGILLQGKLRPAEHQALLARLQTVPSWVHVTDDVTFGNSPSQNPNQ
jgi:serine/threonine protein kinase